MDIISALIPIGSIASRKTLAEILSAFPNSLLEFVADAGTRIHALGQNETYRDASPALKRLGIDVDTWPAPPAGLFVVEERTVYVRSTSPMTVTHEFGHALDCALGSGIYHSGACPEIRSAFSTARAFVTPYAATGIDEYFAEACRAFVGVNDAASAWPRATRERLQRVDPTIFDIIANIFAEFASDIHDHRASQGGSS